MALCQGCLERELPEGYKGMYCPDRYDACKQMAFRARHPKQNQSTAIASGTVDLGIIRETLQIVASEITATVISAIEIKLIDLSNTQKEQLEALRRELVVMPQVTLPAVTAQSGLKTIAGVRPLPPPDFEDLEITVTVARKDQDNNPTWNFIISSAINVYGTAKGLDQNIIDYGLRTERLKQEHLQ